MVTIWPLLLIHTPIPNLVRIRLKIHSGVHKLCEQEKPEMAAKLLQWCPSGSKRVVFKVIKVVPIGSSQVRLGNGTLITNQLELCLADDKKCQAGFA